MRTVARISLVLVVCASVAAGGVAIVVRLQTRSSKPRYALQQWTAVTQARTPEPDMPEPPLPKGVFVDVASFEDSGAGLAGLFTGPIDDPSSLDAIRDALADRGNLGLAVMRAKLDRLHLDDDSPPARRTLAVYQRRDFGLLLASEGRFKEAAKVLDEASALAEGPAAVPARDRLDLTALRGLIAMRQGELENCIECVGPSSCVFPIAPEAVHRIPSGSRAAIGFFSAYLKELPGDLRVRWLLNLAYMTLGEYPEKVPPDYLIRLDRFRTPATCDRFENVATAAGLTVRGPNMAGGSVFDDFTGDGRADLLTTSLDADRGASLFVNRGDGTFEDRSDSAGLAKQIHALNITRADYDNDGALDVLLLRGGWENRVRPSLLRNRGDGTFGDVTIASGLVEPISSESAAWGDYDNDGFVDLFVCGEYESPDGNSPDSPSDPRNRCRLYHNERNGTFRDVAAHAGVAAELCAKGSAWGDYDDDGLLDLYVSNLNGPCRLFHNEGDGTFRDVTSKLGVEGATSSFAVWFWDYDNDGRLDLYVNDFFFSLAETVASFARITTRRTTSPRLYRNLGAEGFHDVAADVGLNLALTPMGCNFGDIDNDGFLDIYLGNGGMSFEYLVPNVLLRNVGGKRFEDVTLPSRTGHIQKGHGVSFADYDNDGDQDLFVELGGAVSGDRAHNALFRNPLRGQHWLKLKLVGTTTNRAAVGARVRVTVDATGGAARSIYRTIGNNSSFGGNSLVELFGLGSVEHVQEIEVNWPTSRTRQVFRDVSVDRTLQIVEGSNNLQPIEPTAPGGH